MIAQIVKFRSELKEDQVMEMYNKRAPRYREMKGLKQKFYLKYSDTGEYGAIYLWEDESSLHDFQESDLGRTIGAKYKVQGNPEILKAEVVMKLHDS